MCKRNLGLLVLAFAVCCLSGCSVGDRADISPDGKTVVLDHDGTLIFRDIHGKLPDKSVKIRETSRRSGSNPTAADSPRYSPDGNWVVAESGGDCVLIDTRTLHKTTIPGWDAPFAWKPDSSEVVGFRLHTAEVFNMKSRSVVRSYDLESPPQFAVWAGDGRDLAFARADEIEVIHQGVVTRKSVHDSVAWLGYDPHESKILWVEVKGTDKNSLRSATSVKEIGEDLRDETTLLAATSTSKLFGTDRMALPCSLSLSPNRNALATCGIVDESPPGVLDKYVELSKKRVPAAQMRAIEKRLRFSVRSVITPLGAGASSGPIVAYRSKIMGYDNIALDMKNMWTSDGKEVAVLLNDQIHLAAVPQ